MKMKTKSWAGGSQTIPDSVGFQCGDEKIRGFLKKLGPFKKRDGSQVEMAHVRFADAGKTRLGDHAQSGQQTCLGKFGRSSTDFQHGKPIFFVVSCFRACLPQPGTTNQRLRHGGSAIVHFAFLVKWLHGPRTSRDQHDLGMLGQIGTSAVPPNRPCSGSHWA